MSRRTVNAILLCALCAVVGGASFFAGKLVYTPKAARVEQGNAISACLDTYPGKYSGKTLALGDLVSAFQLCRNLVVAKLEAEEQAIRNEVYAFQQYENNVVMWLVAAITGGGVVLAGLQLLGSYKLAARRRSALAEGGQVDLTRDHLVVKSSYVGVLILAISFAFYVVFVLFVYKIQDDRNIRDDRAASRPPTADGRPALPAENRGRIIAPPSQ